jgi:hypothetical protein
MRAWIGEGGTIAEVLPWGDAGVDVAFGSDRATVDRLVPLSSRP